MVIPAGVIKLYSVRFCETLFISSVLTGHDSEAGGRGAWRTEWACLFVQAARRYSIWHTSKRHYLLSIKHHTWLAVSNLTGVI